MVNDEEGQKALDLLIQEINSPLFLDSEKRLIEELRGKKYKTMTKREKQIVIRLFGWLNGA